VLRVLEREIDRYMKLPPEFIEEEAKATTEAYSRVAAEELLGKWRTRRLGE